MSFEVKVLGRELLTIGKSAPTTTNINPSGSSIIDPSTYRGLDSLNGSILYPEYTRHTDLTKAYVNCPVLGTVIARKSSAFSEGIITANDLRTGQELTDESWINIIRRPNAFQTEDQFKTQIYTYCSIYGYALAFKDSEGIGTSWSINSLWALPMEYIEVKFKKNTFLSTDASDLIERITMTVDGDTIEIDPDCVHMFTYKGPSVSGSQLFTNTMVPKSPLVGIEKPIENVIMSYEAAGSLIKYRGALGILSSKGVDAAGHTPIHSDEKDELQKSWNQYGIRGTQKKVIITKANLDWLQIGMKVKDLMLHEEIKESSGDIADRFGYPAHLLRFGKGTTFNNMEIADKRTYTNAIIPEAVHFVDQLNRFLQTELNGFCYKIDFSHVEALQEDKKQAAEARKKLNDALKIEYDSNQITKNEWRIKLGEEEVQGWDVYKYEFDAMINENSNENE